jgi:hypothetical protein
MTEFFVTPSRRPISLAQMPSFHQVMSAVARDGVHSCVKSLNSRPILAKKGTPSFAIRTEKTMKTVYYAAFLTQYTRKRAFVREHPEVSAQCEANVTPWRVAEGKQRKCTRGGRPSGGGLTAR